MGNFFVVVHDAGHREHAEQLFRNGIEGLTNLKSQRPSRVYGDDFAHAASFARLNGTGAPVTVDSSGAWVVAVGTWFHSQGFASGSEARLLQRFVESGADRVAGELEGFFVILFGDPRSREVVVITDIIGSCHCFVRTWDGMVAISSSSLHLAVLGDSSLDPIGCQEFMATASMSEDRTFFEKVRKLGPVSCHRFRDGRLHSSSRYWDLRALPPDSLNEKQATSALRESVIGAARRIAAVFPRIACDLTGGYDSRFAVAAFLSAGLPIATAVSGPSFSPDVVTSKALSGRLGLPLRYQNPDSADTLDTLQKALELTDGEFNIVEYSRTYAVQRELSNHFDISVNGYAGEHGRGYGWEVLFPWAGSRRPLDPGHLAKRRLTPRTFDASVFPPGNRIDFQTHFTQVVGRTNHGLGDLPNTAQYDYCLLMLRASRWQGRIASATNQVWPCLSFFLLRSVLDVMLRINSNVRRRSYLFRKLLLEMQPGLAAYPLATGYPPLPVSWRTLHRFLPIVPEYLGRASGKVRRQLGFRKPSNHDSSLRLRLWNDPGIRDVLGGDALSLEILDRKALADFLERSKREDFPYGSQWFHLLSLECALQRLKSVKRSLDQVRTC
jgi:hypothetical protein